MLVFVAVVVTAAAAEVLALILLAFPCDPGAPSCAAWPPGLTGPATLAAATAIPAAFALIVAHGAITSKLPWELPARAAGRIANIAVRAAVGAMTFISSGGLLLALGARAGAVAGAVALSALSALFTRLKDRNGGARLDIEVFGLGITLEGVEPSPEAGDGHTTDRANDHGKHPDARPEPPNR